MQGIGRIAPGVESSPRAGKETLLFAPVEERSCHKEQFAESADPRNRVPTLNRDAGPMTRGI